MSNQQLPSFTPSERRILAKAFWTDRLGEQQAQAVIYGLTPPPEKLTDEWDDFCRRVESGEPYQYVLGYVSFANCRIDVNPHVLIPRPETEELVYETSKRMDAYGCFLDVGTGSGAIAIGLKKMQPEWKAFGCDISKGALATAEKNAKQNKFQVDFFTCDIRQPKTNPHPSLDLLISNPPYIPQAKEKDLDKTVLDFEPHLALFTPDEKPLLYYEHIIDYGIKHLNENGLLALETHFDGAQNIADLLANHNFTDIEIIKDLYQHERFVFARKRCQAGN